MSLGYLARLGAARSQFQDAPADVSPVTRAVQGAGAAIMSLVGKTPAQRVCPEGYTNDPVNPGNCIPVAVAMPVQASSVPSWVVPAAVVGGGLVLVLLLKGRK